MIDKNNRKNVIKIDSGLPQCDGENQKNLEYDPSIDLFGHWYVVYKAFGASWSTKCLCLHANDLIYLQLK